MHELFEKLGIRHDYQNVSSWVRPDRPWLKWMREKKMPLSIQYPEIPFYKFLDIPAELFPNNVAINFVPKDIKYTYRELKYFSDQIAAGLHALGVKKGDIIAIMTVNCPEFITCTFGILKVGAIFSPLNPLLAPKDIEYIINDAENIHSLIIHENLYSQFEKIKDNVELKNIIIIGTKKIPDTILLDDLLKKSHRPPPPIEINPKEDLAALMYTGGTTGLPKGVMITHYNLGSNTSLVSADPDMNTRVGKSSSLIALPICHAFGLIMIAIMICSANMIVLFDKFDVKAILKAIDLYKVRTFVGIPTMYQMLLSHPEIEKYDLSSLEVCGSGSFPLSSELAEKWKSLTGVDCFIAYGLTETSAATHISYWVPHKDLSIGIPVCDTDVKIIDPITHEELGPNQVGEMVIKGPQVMKGYWKRPELTQRVLKDGWLHTGDLAKYDEDGYFYIIGRQSDTIKYKGYKVFPKEIEDVLYSHPAVAECTAFGIPDPKLGQQIVAYVVLKRKQKVTADELIAFCKERMAPYKSPRIIRIQRIIPKTPVGKVNKKVIVQKELKRKRKGNSFD